MSERIFLPVRRGDDVLVYEYFEVPAQRRWQFRVVLAAESEEGELVRTGTGMITDEEIDLCKGLVARMDSVVDAFEAVRLSDISTYRGLLEAGESAAVVTNSMLFTSTLYLNLMRQCLVEESSVSRYESRAPSERFDIGLSASIYDGLVKRYDLKRAEAILDADLPHAKPPKRLHREWSYFYKTAAEIKLRRGKKQAGVGLLEKAVLCQPDAATHRRIASLHLDVGDRPAAIAAFERSHELEPLPAKPRLRLAWCYFQEGDRQKAADFAAKSLDMGNGQAGKLLERLKEDNST
ncbi:tetratricopeptide repeat protein [Algicella marina]|uniref:Tetratricopeptide repeat protein n=1 Tax=Algicella marina TaxID=2683284 RepID=A0A6P1T4K1_9RHOB|nr:tetratricopeptide repeat protein [Algicella marina]QHQ36623.1 tetratricopeptide repeat protein [Algicella marina]